MPINNSGNSSEVQEKINALINRCSNLVLASVTDDGDPLSSQAPYAKDADGNFLILVSALAEHGKTLKGASNINLTPINIMIMEDESDLVNPFARERLNYNCTVEGLKSGSTAREHGEQLLKERFGNFIDTLIALPDFTMYRLSPIDGRYVSGFGAAYIIADGDIKQVTSKS